MDGRLKDLNHKELVALIALLKVANAGAAQSPQALNCGADQSAGQVN